MKVKTFLFLVLLFGLVIVAVVIRIGPMLFTTEKTVETVDEASSQIYATSLFSYVKASEMAYTLNVIEDKKKIKDCDINGSSLICGKVILNVDVRGNVPTSGSLAFDENGKVVKVENALISNFICSYDGNYKCVKEN